MDKFLAMKMFMATVETQGFSAAARKMAVAISPVTRLVDALEAELGTTLFNRSTRQVSLTEAGLRYYTRAREIFEALEAADASAPTVARNRRRLASPGIAGLPGVWPMRLTGSASQWQRHADECEQAAAAAVEAFSAPGQPGADAKRHARQQILDHTLHPCKGRSHHHELQQQVTLRIDELR